MSFSDNPFDKFNPESKLSEFRKRFEDFTQKSNNRSNNMFFESKHPNGWPLGLNNRRDIFSMAKNGNLNKMPNNESEGIPIKVVHEKSDNQTIDDNNEDRNEMNCSANSCSGSSSNSHNSCGQKSSSSGNSNTSKASVFSNGSQTQPNEGSVEPRIHHIPIQVEPRDGSTSSGYTSEPNPNPSPHVIPNDNPLSRSSSGSSRHSVQSSRSNAFARSPSPAKSVSSNHSNNSSNSTNSAKPRVCQIPIQIETNVSQNSRSPLSNENVSKVKSNGLGQSSAKPIKSKSGPFVTRIPVGKSDNSSEEHSLTSESPPNKQTIKLNALEIIEKVLNDLQKYEIEVNEFDGNSVKRYRYLDEMLTRCMIKLDTIETEGKEDVRKARKAAVIAVNKCIALLESKLKNNTNNDSAETTTDEQMVSSTPEPNNQINDKTEGVEQMEVEEKVDDSQEKVESNQTINDNQLPISVEDKEDKNGGNGQRKETAV